VTKYKSVSVRNKGEVLSLAMPLPQLHLVEHTLDEKVPYILLGLSNML